MLELISPLAQVIVAGAAVYGAWNSRNNGQSLAKNAAAIEVIHHQTNSMKDELVKEVRKAAKAEGKAEGAAEERAD